MGGRGVFMTDGSSSSESWRSGGGGVESRLSSEGIDDTRANRDEGAVELSTVVGVAA